MELQNLVTVHPAAGAQKRIAVFYLHGGGLLYGERDDLPAPYVSLLTGAGYELVCADYPLAPERALPQVVDAVYETWRGAVGERAAAGELAGYYLFGRSAGGHLALMLAREIARRGDGMPTPRGILDFYGYPGLADAAFSQPAKAYAALPEVSRAQVERIAPAGAEPVTSGPKALRYSLYVHARQHEGAWLDLMGLDGSAPDRTAEAWSLTAEEIAQLPPLFITASSGDEDVPLRISKALWRAAKGAVMKTVYYLPHDFDRDISDPTGMQVYRAALEWMDKQEG